jgi:putative hemolysin
VSWWATGSPPRCASCSPFTIVTYLSVLLGELVPKALALDRAERLAVLIARPVELIGIALGPVVWVLQESARVVLRPFGIRDVVAGDSIRGLEELRALVDEAESAGVIPLTQEELLHNVLDVADREARDIMVPAPDVAWLDAELTAGVALGRALETAHSRLLVGRGTLDRLVGACMCATWPPPPERGNRAPPKCSRASGAVPPSVTKRSCKTCACASPW